MRTFASCLAFLLLTACNRRSDAPSAEDVRLSRAVAGTWRVERSNLIGVLTFQPDGSYSGFWSNQVRPKGWRFDGEWKIVNGSIVQKLKHATYWNYTNDVVLDQEASYKISHVDDHELQTTNDPEIKWTRTN
jgi:hypothetical protein